MEVMGLMLGEFVDDYTVRVVDVFAMPQSGTGEVQLLKLCLFLGIIIKGNDQKGGDLHGTCASVVDSLRSLSLYRSCITHDR